MSYMQIIIMQQMELQITQIIFLFFFKCTELYLVSVVQSFQSKKEMFFFANDSHVLLFLM